MATKQRYQNLALGDTARLQSFVLNNGECAFVKAVAKVEIFQKVPSVATLQNPDGLVPVQTIVSHLGRPTTEIFPYPSASRPEYWETDLYIDSDEYQITQYVDRWHYILDEDYDFYYPIARTPYPDILIGRDAEYFLGVLGSHVFGVTVGASTVVKDSTGAACAFDITHFPVGQNIEVYGDYTSSSVFTVSILSQETASPGPTAWLGEITGVNYSTGYLIMSLFYITRHNSPMVGRIPRINGITDGTGSFEDLTYTQAIAEIENPTDKGIQDTVLPTLDPPHWGIPDGFFADPLSIAGYIITEYTPTADPYSAPPTGGKKYAYFKAVSANGTDWTCSFTINPVFDVPSPDYVLSSMEARVSNDMLRFNLHWDISGSPPFSENVAVLAWMVDEWQIEGIEYDAGKDNPWDDLIARTAESKKLTVDHSFQIWPEQWMATSRPIPSQWAFSVEPPTYYVNSKSWMRVTVAPLVELHPETQRYHFTLLATGTLRYEIFRYESSGTQTRFRRIVQGIAYWHEENTALLRIDTSRTPLNRGMDCFIVFYVDLPDGTTIRSGKTNFQVIDDLRIARSDDVVI